MEYLYPLHHCLNKMDVIQWTYCMCSWTESHTMWAQCVDAARLIAQQPTIKHLITGKYVAKHV